MKLWGWIFGIPLLWLVYRVYAALPADLWTAWLLLLIKSGPMLVTTTVAIAVRWVDRASRATSFPEGRSAGGWLLDRLKRERRLDIKLVDLSDDDTLNCYHSESRTIALADAVHHGTGPGDYATAAHELGHALMHARAPRLLRLTLWCRAQGDRCFNWGWLVLVAVVATGITGALPAAELCFAAAALAHTVVALDEAIASKIAMRELRAAGLDRRQRWTARVDLLAAFASYASYAILAGGVLWMWPQLEAWIGEGGASPGKPLGDWLELLSMFLAAGLLAGAASALWLTVRPPNAQRTRLLSTMMMVAGIVWAPPLFLLVYDQPIAAVAPWALVLLAVPAFDMLAIPLNWALSLVQRIALKLLGPPDRAIVYRLGPPVRSIPLESLGGSEERKTRVPLTSRVYFALGAPLAYLYLDQLFNG